MPLPGAQGEAAGVAAEDAGQDVVWRWSAASNELSPPCGAANDALRNWPRMSAQYAGNVVWRIELRWPEKGKWKLKKVKRGGEPGEAMPAAQSS